MRWLASGAMSRFPRTLPTLLCAAGLALSVTALAPATGHADESGSNRSRPQKIETLPLGDDDLPEERSTRNLAPGVSLTSIVRGDEPAEEDEYTTTTRGPWQVQVLSIDPKKADGHLSAAYGPDLSQTETTSEIAAQADALAAMNASFFTFTASKEYPGEPTGTGIYAGQLLSEPKQADPRDQSVLIDAANNSVRMDKLAWSQTYTNKKSGHAVQVEAINHPPVVPEACADLTDQAECAEDGDLVTFTEHFHDTTPSGPGIEVVLDQRDCVVRSSEERGTELAAGQTSIQATGRGVVALQVAASDGCLKQGQVLTGENGKKVKLKDSTSAVTARYRLIEDGSIVAPEVIDDFTDRNPRSAIGTTRKGEIVLFTVDGRQPDSVGTTLKETAEVAESLGLQQAMNLDGGGSTTMVAEDEVVNSVSGKEERPVGDALVWVDQTD